MHNTAINRVINLCAYAHFCQEIRLLAVSLIQTQKRCRSTFFIERLYYHTAASSVCEFGTIKSTDIITERAVMAMIEKPNSLRAQIRSSATL